LKVTIGFKDEERCFLEAQQMQVGNRSCNISCLRQFNFPYLMAKYHDFDAAVS
jgi:hypothetical protein